MSTAPLLAQMFLLHRSGSGPASDLTPEALEIRLQEVLATAVKVWPEFRLPPLLFVKHLAQKLQDDVPVTPSLTGLHSSDLYLACACLHGESRAIAALDKQFFTHVPGWVSSIRADSSFADDVRQVLHERLLISSAKSRAKIAEYSGRGPLISWLRIAAVRIAIDIQRKDRPLQSESDDEHAEQILRLAPSAEVEYIKVRYQGLLGRALREALSSLSDEEHNLVRLYYTDGLSMDQLGAIFGVNRSTIKRRMDGACSRLLIEIKRSLRQHLQLTSAQIRSLVNQLLSRFEMTSSVP